VDEADLFILAANLRGDSAGDGFEEFVERVISRAVDSWGADYGRGQQIGDGSNCFFACKLAAPIGGDGRGVGFFIHGLVPATGAYGCKRAYVDESFYARAMFEGGCKYRFGSSMIGCEVILRSPGERKPRDVIDRIDILECFVPVGRFIETAVADFYLRMFDVAQVAGLSRKTAQQTPALDEQIDQMASDETRAAGDQNFSPV
jgi:hypothetical protein